MPLILKIKKKKEQKIFYVYDMLKKLEHMMHCIDYIQREMGGVFNPHPDYFFDEPYLRIR